jgi:hypothetical protein
MKKNKESFSSTNLQRKDWQTLVKEECKEIKEDKRKEERAKNDLLKHMDVFRRKTRTKLEDQYIDPVDGQLEPLVVQPTSQIYNQRNKTTWRRTYIRNVSSYTVRLAYWPTSHTFDKTKWQDWVYRGLCWLLSSICLLIVVRSSLAPFFCFLITFDKNFADDLSNGCGGSDQKQWILRPFPISILELCQGSKKPIRE